MNRLVGERFLSFQPIFEASGCETMGQFAEHLSISRRNAERYREHGVVLRTADRWCDLFGLHPSIVWGVEYRDAVAWLELWQEMQQERRNLSMRIYTEQRTRARRERRLWGWEWSRVDWSRELDRINQFRGLEMV